MKSPFLVSFLFFVSMAHAQDEAPPDVSTPAVQALTLKQCFDLALRQSESLQIQEEEIRQAEARFKQAMAAVLPDIKWNATKLIQDTSANSSGGTGVQGTLTRRERNESKFVVEQPLFRGFKEFAAMKGFKKEGVRERLLLKRAGVTLFEDVAEAFYLVIRLQTEFMNVQTLSSLTRERVDELQERVNLGKSRTSEILSAEAQLAAVKSQEARVRAQIAVARELLSFLIGRDAGSAVLVDVVQRPAAVPEAEALVERAKSRSDIEALRAEAEARRYARRVARAAYWPSLDLTGNYYTNRTGFQEEIDWDILFNLDVPIFQGGETTALARAAHSELRQSRAELARLERQVESEVRTAHASYLLSTTEATFLEEAYRKARRSYELQRKEYRLGLVNNLEVLQALNNMQELKRQWNSAVIESKLNWLKLQATVEEVP